MYLCCLLISQKRVNSNVDVTLCEMMTNVGHIFIFCQWIKMILCLLCTDHKFMFWMMICWMKSKCIYEVACDTADVLFTIFVKGLNVSLTLIDVVKTQVSSLVPCIIFLCCYYCGKVESPMEGIKLMLQYYYQVQFIRKRRSACSIYNNPVFDTTKKVHRFFL